MYIVYRDKSYLCCVLFQTLRCFNLTL